MSVPQRWLRMNWVLTLPLLMCPEPCNKPPFSAFTRPLQLEFRGGRLDLAYGISGAWALDPKLRFHVQDPEPEPNLPGGLCVGRSVLVGTVRQAMILREILPLGDYI
jgi:hypothetical protein